MRGTWRALIAGVLFAAATTTAQPVSAQNPTPAAGCTVAPRTVAEVVAAGASAATPVAPFDLPGAATPAPVPAVEPTGPGTPLEIVLPLGEPAPAGATEAMRSTLEAFLACQNAGDVLRTLALVTDDYVVESFGRSALTEENVAAYAAVPRPVPPEYQRAVAAVREARVLPGGRLAALFDLAATGGPAPGEIRTDFVVFAPTADGYAVDAIQAGLPPEEFGPGAQPAG